MHRKPWPPGLVNEGWSFRPTQRDAYKAVSMVVSGTASSAQSAQIFWRPADRQLLRVAVLRYHPNTSYVQNCGDQVGYACQFLLMLKTTANVTSVPLFGATEAEADARSAADVLVLPHWCTINRNMLPEWCLNDKYLRDDDPPLIVVLNKVFEAQTTKLALLRRHRARILLAVAHTPKVAMLENQSRVPTIFLPYGAAVEFGAQSGNSSVAFDFDFGFSGGHTSRNTRYAFRRQVLGNKSLYALAGAGLRLRKTKMKTFSVGYFKTPEAYIQALATTKVWLATTELPDHVSTRFFEVLISGRSLLLCDRNAEAYAPLGIVEGVHAAMFNSSAEFSAQVQYYANPVHETERQAMVMAGSALVTGQHTWVHRGRELLRHIRHAFLHHHRQVMRSSAAGSGGRLKLRNATAAASRHHGVHALRRPGRRAPAGGTESNLSMEAVAMASPRRARQHAVLPASPLFGTRQCRGLECRQMVDQPLQLHHRVMGTQPAQLRACSGQVATVGASASISAETYLSACSQSNHRWTSWDARSYFDSFWMPRPPFGAECEELTRFGPLYDGTREGDGGKTLCNARALLSQPHCLVVSVGLKDDTRFESVLHQAAPHCEVPRLTEASAWLGVVLRSHAVARALPGTRLGWHDSRSSQAAAANVSQILPGHVQSPFVQRPRLPATTCQPAQD